MKPGPGPWWRSRRSRIRSQWPTRLPGIRFCAHGTLTYQAPARLKASGSASARAVARLALDELGRTIAQDHFPEQLDIAQERLTIAAAHWHTREDAPDLWLRARITLVLAEQDTKRAQGFQDALREVSLQLAQEEQQRELFRRSILDKPHTARMWWLERHLDDLDALDWDDFNKKVLPLVGAVDDVQSRTERMAQSLQYVWEKLGNEPGQHARFITTARSIVEQMGWDDAPWPPLDEPTRTDPPKTADSEAGLDPIHETGAAR